MKPKERFINYALLSTNHCDPNPNRFKEDIPIDLSTKKVVPNEHPFSLFKEYEAAPFHSPPHLNDWSARYCFPNLVAKHYGCAPNIFPYLFINPNCLSGTEMEHKREESLFDPFGVQYRMPHESVLYPYHLASAQYQQLKDKQVDRPPPSNESASTSSTSSSPYNNPEYHSIEYNDHNKFYSKPSPVIVEMNHHKKSKRSHVVHGRKAILKKSLSYPCLQSALSRSNKPSTADSLHRSKSECNLHLIKSYTNSARICAPKKLFASNYYQNKLKEDLKEVKGASPNTISSTTNHSRQVNGTPTRFYRNYRKEVIECWDNENKDNRSVSHQSSRSDVLDLRMNNHIPKPIHSPEIDSSKGTCEPKLSPYETEVNNSELIKHPLPMPLDLYQQYYYYLIHEPGFASRAAVAVAETYAKLLSNTNTKENKFQPNWTKSQNVDKFENGPIYETKRTSPDFIMNGSKTELRSADTTNGSLSFDRKRISRPLTGKHVRHGTGASPSTLVSLRNMIQQRQKLKQVGKLSNSTRYSKSKGSKRTKRK